MPGGVRSCECVLACVSVCLRVCVCLRERENRGARKIEEGECCIKYVCVCV